MTFIFAFNFSGSQQLSCTEVLIKVYKKIKDKVIAHRLHVLGFILAKLSGIIFTINNAIIQTMELDFSEVMFVRGTVQVFILTFLIISNGYSFLPYVWNDPIKVRFLTIFQGIFAGLAITCAVSCVRYMPLGDALTLLFTSPLTTMILAAIFLKHPFRLYRSLNALLLITGAILVIKPSFIFGRLINWTNWIDWVDPLTKNYNNTNVVLFNHVYQDRQTIDYHNPYYHIGAAIAMSSTVFSGFLFISINSCKDVESIVLLWWAGIGAIISSFIGFTFDPDAKMMNHHIYEIPPTHWMAYFGIALSGMLGFFFMTKSLQMIDPTVVAFIRALEIIFGYVFQVFVMQQIPTVLSLVGTGLVLISIIAISLQNILIVHIPENIRFLF